MIVGGWGPNALTAVERAARRLGAVVSYDGPLVLAAPAGALVEGSTERHRVWFSGRGDVQDLEEEMRPGISVANAVARDFDRVGSAAQARLHGAYVAVVLDRARRKVLVWRDHLGARTLSFVGRGADTFFAEHVVDLLALLPATPAPDRLAVVQWINSRSVLRGRSLFEGVLHLPSGHSLEISDSGFAVRPFWQPIYREPVRMSRSDSAAAIREAAFAAVLRAVDDLQRPAVKLSGGLDSACVAAGLARADRGRQALAFSCTFPGYPEVDEASLVAQTAETTGLELVSRPYADTPIFPPVLAYIRHWALPPGSPNIAIWQPLMADVRARGVDGLLDGEGGDEQFGLPPYLIADCLRRGHLLRAWRLAGQLPGLGRSPAVRLRLAQLRVYGISGVVPRGTQDLRRRLRDPREGIDPLVADVDVPGLIATDEQWDWKTIGDGPLWWRDKVDSAVNGHERLDASGEMARHALDAGVDQRHPFIHDARLVEAVLAVSPEEQFDAIRDRAVLRDGLVGVIPEAVRTRYAKSYFNEVATSPLAGAEGAALLDQVESPKALVREYVRAVGLEELRTIGTARGWQRHRLAGRLFRVASVDSWLQHMYGPGPVDGLPTPNRAS
jgi:asparagine synthase (glutamine-hydrolysing)